MIPAAPPSGPTLGSTVFTWTNLPAVPTQVGEELVFVREGTLEAIIHGVPHCAGPGSVFFFASHGRPGLRNPGAVRTRYHVGSLFLRDLAK
jgi:hypothetical protein